MAVLKSKVPGRRQLVCRLAVEILEPEQMRCEDANRGRLSGELILPLVDPGCLWFPGIEYLSGVTSRSGEEECREQFPRGGWLGAADSPAPESRLTQQPQRSSL